MARAAVKAKQQGAAKAQAAKPARGRRRGHKGGGNPNQELFFVRLRRHQKWVYALLAVVFGLSFVLVGVGSGNGGGLTQLWNSIFSGAGGTSVSKAQAAAKKDPAKYNDLATAYEQAGHPALAIGALTKYLAVKPKDAASWSLLGGLQLSQGSTYSTQFQNAQQAAQAADPSAPFLPGGTLGSAVGQNPTYAGASQTAIGPDVPALPEGDRRIHRRRQRLPESVEPPAPKLDVPAGARAGRDQRRQQQGRRQLAAEVPGGLSERSAEEGDRAGDQGAPGSEHGHAVGPDRQRPPLVEDSASARG